MQNINVLVEGKRVVKIAPSEILTNPDRVIDATGLFLAPGLVDPQVHFREPGMEYK